MAMNAVEFIQPIRYQIDLKDGLVQKPMSTQLMKGDAKANRVIVALTNYGELVDLSSTSVNGKFIRPPDEATIPLEGSTSGNEAIVELNDACYAEDGYCEINVILTVGGTRRTILALTGYVLKNGSGAVVDVGDVIPSIDDIIAQYAEMQRVTQATQAAGISATTAASNANEKAQAAQSASEAANAGAQAAQTAAGVANAAAGKIDNMTVSATALDTGQPPTAALSEVDGRYLLLLGLPRGATGATPQISVKVTTGAPGSQASVSVTGTAENPVIHLTIPRGDTGSIEGLTINGKVPDASGDVTLDMEDIDGLAEAIEGAGGVKTVAGVSPDSAGNVPLTAANVGARPSTWTPSASDVGAYPAESIRVLTISLAASAWTGSGPYTATINQAGVTANTDCRFELGGTQTSLTADIAWETAAGTITLTTAAKPTGTISGTVILTEVIV